MSFPTNSSPYGVNRPQYQASPAGNGSSSNPFWESLFGKKEKNYQQSLLAPDQMQNYQQLIGASNQRGAGGAFGQSADYYRDLLSDDSSTANAMFAPEQRRFQEQIIPDLAEQFAGMGSGGLSSSGFRNAAVNAGTDLSERLGAIRAQLRSQGAAGLSDIGSKGLNQFSENIHRPETFGLVGNFAEGAGQGFGKAAGGALFL